MNNEKKEYYKQFDESYYTTDGYDDYLKIFSEEAEKIIIPVIMKTIKPTNDFRFLDVGCSLGGNIMSLQKRGFTAKGVEISPYCLNNSPVKESLCFGECHNLPFANKSFDVVMCFDIFMYLTEDEIKKSVKELVRVSTRYILFTTIDNFSKNADQKHNPDSLRKDTVHLYSKKDYARLFEEAGARCLEKDFFPSGWDFSALFEIPR